MTTRLDGGPGRFGPSVSAYSVSALLLGNTCKVRPKASGCSGRVGTSKGLSVSKLFPIQPATFLCQCWTIICQSTVATTVSFSIAVLSSSCIAPSLWLPLCVLAALCCAARFAPTQLFRDLPTLAPDLRPPRYGHTSACAIVHL